MSVLTEGLASSEKPRDPLKAIFAVREVFHEHVYQTRGMACAVNVGGSVRLVTWRGVIDSAAYNNVVMDRFSKTFFRDVTRYRLQKSTVTTSGNFSFLSVNYSENFTILQYKVPGNEVIASELTAYSFSGEETIELKFRYDKIKKEHELITTGDEWKKRITEKSSLLGSPVMVIDEKKRQARAVVGVVGVSDDGKIVPFFITEKEFDQERNATEEEEEKEEVDALFVPEGGGAADDKLDHERNQTESVNSTSSQNDKSSSGKDVPDAKFGSVAESGEKGSVAESGEKGSVAESGEKGSVAESGEKGSVAESSEKVRSGAIPIQYLPYLALDIQSTKEWPSLGRALGVDESYLSGIEIDHDEDYERCYKMLKHWQQQSGTALYSELAKALEEVDLCDIRTKYCYEENDPPTQKYQKISGELKAGRVSNKDLSGIARAVKGKRKRLGRALGVSDDQIDTVVEENRTSVSEQSYQILQKWVWQKGSHATYDALAQALLDRTVMMTSVMKDYCLAPENK